MEHKRKVYIYIYITKTCFNWRWSLMFIAWLTISKCIHIRYFQDTVFQKLLGVTMDPNIFWHCYRKTFDHHRKSRWSVLCKEGQPRLVLNLYYIHLFVIFHSRLTHTSIRNVWRATLVTQCRKIMCLLYSR